ncbi:nose resistant to fluoxetine protein 6-like [Amblyomma americanum]
MFDKFYDGMDKQWYTLLLQVRNFGGGLETGSFQHLWYISTDFQLFLVGICIIQIFRRKHWAAIAVMSGLSLACCSYSAWQMYNSDYYPFPVILGKTYKATIDTLNDVYVLPTYHAVCYFSGCITLLLLLKYKDSHISNRTAAVLWCISTACCLACVFNKYDWNRGEPPEGNWAKMAFGFGDKIAWSFSLSWSTFALSTGRGGYLNSFLGWKHFVPLSRLTLGLYVIHVPFLNLYYNASRERLYYSTFSLATLFFAALVWSLLLSILLFATCEAPTGRLEKQLFSCRAPARDKKPKVVASYVKNNDVEEAKKNGDYDAKFLHNTWSRL